MLCTAAAAAAAASQPHLRILTLPLLEHGIECTAAAAAAAAAAPQPHLRILSLHIDGRRARVATGGVTYPSSFSSRAREMPSSSGGRGRSIWSLGEY